MTNQKSLDKKKSKEIKKGVRENLSILTNYEKTEIKITRGGRSMTIGLTKNQLKDLIKALKKI